MCSPPYSDLRLFSDRSNIKRRVIARSALNQARTRQLFRRLLLLLPRPAPALRAVCAVGNCIISHRALISPRGDRDISQEKLKKKKKDHYSSHTLRSCFHVAHRGIDVPSPVYAISLLLQKCFFSRSTFSLSLSPSFRARYNSTTMKGT